MKCKGCGARLGKVPEIQVVWEDAGYASHVQLANWCRQVYSSDETAICLDCMKRELDKAIKKRDAERKRRTDRRKESP